MVRGTAGLVFGLAVFGLLAHYGLEFQLPIDKQFEKIYVPGLWTAAVSSFLLMLATIRIGAKMVKEKPAGEDEIPLVAFQDNQKLGGLTHEPVAPRRSGIVTHTPAPVRRDADAPPSYVNFIDD